MNTIPSRSQFRFSCPIPTRWGDVDRIGHINNVQYFRYDEQARTEYFAARYAQSHGPDAVPGIILARIGCDFIAQLHHPATIDHAIRVTRIGRRSLALEGGIFVGDTCYARTESVVVWFDYARQVTADVPEALRAHLRDYEVVKPQE